MKLLPGTDLHCYLDARIRDTRLRFFLNGLVWTAVAAAVTLIVLNGLK